MIRLTDQCFPQPSAGFVQAVQGAAVFGQLDASVRARIHPGFRVRIRKACGELFESLFVLLQGLKLFDMQLRLIHFVEASQDLRHLIMRRPMLGLQAQRRAECLFRLGRPDVLPVGDLGVRKGFMLTYRKPEMPAPQELLAHGERWRPYRSVASWYMWRAIDLAHGKPKPGA